MKIKIIKCLQDNYSYVIIDENNQSACVVDPSESKPIIDFIDNNKIDLKYILNTHHHHDHIGGNLELKKKYNCDVIGFKDDKDRIPGINILVENNQIWQKGNFEAKIYHTPGHTSGHIAFHFFKEKIIFTGDTLFSLGCGRIFEGTYEQMFNSLKIFKKLPKDTLIYCGHEYTLKNSEFCVFNDPDNLKLKEKIVKNFDSCNHYTKNLLNLVIDERDNLWSEALFEDDVDLNLQKTLKQIKKLIENRST